MSVSKLRFGFIFVLLRVVISVKSAFALVTRTSGRNKRHKSCQIEESRVSEGSLEVWNNVVDCKELATLLDDESRRIGLGHKVFFRAKDNDTADGNRNIIENVLDSILVELNDDAEYVEYWTRREWRSIHAHADVDEHKAKAEGSSAEIIGNEFRYPRNGHVLYLKVGDKVRGPTCLFPNRKSGGDLLRSLNMTSISGDGENISNVDQKPGILPQDEIDDAVEVVTVPAVPGRLLRFQGDYLHAVPRPTDLWLLKFVKGSPTYEPEEEWGRSVVLFNTWCDDPPMGLPIDEETNTVSSRDHYDRTSTQYKCNTKNIWSQEIISSHLSTSTKDIISTDEEPSISAKIWLLGDYRRRDYKMRTIKLEASESLRSALYQPTRVVSTKLKIPP